MAEKSITKFENLSNELLYDIFEYLYGETLFDAFYGLNYRINSILNDSRLLMHITFSRILNIQSIFDSNQIQFVNLSSSRSPIIAVDLQNSSIMPCACRLSMNEVYTPDLIIGLSHIKSRMPNLVHVSIKIDHASDPTSNNIAFIIEGFLDLSYIRTLSLDLRYCSMKTTCIYLSREKRALFLEHLSIIGCNFSLLSIIDLINNSPKLYSLEMKIQPNADCPDYSAFQQLTKATLKLIGFNNNNLQRLFSSMTRIISLRLDDQILISMARLYTSNTARISRVSIGYFNS